MRRYVLIVCACAIVMMPVARAQGPAPAPKVAAPAAAAAKLPVRRVVLYKNGVGYFEHVGRVRGSQSVIIDFNTAQLNDVLQSLTTLDLGGGRIADVSFNSEAPFAQRLGALTLPVAERTTLAELLGALRGARLEVRTAGRVIAGRLLSIERRPRKDDVPRDELTLVSDGGDIQSVELVPGVGVRLAERESADQVGAYLGLLASNRSQNRRRLTIATVGTTEREVMVSYISEVPVWKTTYRLVLPTGGTPVLQGWAVVDNTIGEDWNDVELSLVAGAPQSFIQPLSQPLYSQRPTIGLSRVSGPIPQLHQETMTEAQPSASGRVLDQRGGVMPGVTVTAVDRNGRRWSTVSDTQGRYAFGVLPAGSYRIELTLNGFKQLNLNNVSIDGTSVIQDAMMQVGGVSENVTVTGSSARIDTSTSLARSSSGNAPVRLGGVAGGVTGSAVGGLAAAPPPASPVDRTMVEERLAGMQASAQGQNLGDLFEYRVDGAITIPKNQSALVPIVRADVGIERVSLWSERGGSARPLRSVWLTNSSGMTLDAGSFTVLEGATFAGEGLVDSVKPGEKRLVSYAVDLGVQIDARRGDDQQRVSRIRINRGVAVQQSEQTSRRVYTLRNNDTTARTVIVEHPIRPGWTLVKGAVPVETSLSAYRFAVQVEPKGVATLEVAECHPLDTNYSVSQLSDQQIAVFVRGSREDAQLAQALVPIQAKKAEIASVESEIESRQAEANKIAEDQQRLRENMSALKGGSGEQQLVKRYVAQLNQQEDRIAVLRKETADLNQQLARAREQLGRLIEALTLDLELLAADADADAPLRP
ncbi:MAG TPA: carboxypeptidase regulatory-like domain-containing protein [Vicinamibacterales bacterium]|nr:carboxypeptidase regulatory-like domain-containing protein [Vicinamibacterales bacterium]